MAIGEGISNEQISHKIIRYGGSLRYVKFILILEYQIFVCVFFFVRMAYFTWIDGFEGQKDEQLRIKQKKYPISFVSFRHHSDIGYAFWEFVRKFADRLSPAHQTQVFDAIGFRYYMAAQEYVT